MEDKLDFLTPEQDWELAEWYKTSQQIELSTESVQRDQVEEFIRTAYSAADLQHPKIIWCESPLAMYLSRSIVLLFAESFDCQTGCLSEFSKPSAVDGSSKHFPGENVRWKIRDDRISSSESIVRTACSVHLWYSLTVIELARNWRAASIHDLDAAINPIVRAIGRSLQAIAEFENGYRLSLTDTTWQNALVGAEQVLGYSIPESYRDFKTLSNHRWPFFFSALKGFPRDSGFGQHDMRTLAIPAFFNSVPEVAKKMSVDINALVGLTQSAGWYLPHATVCWISERQKEIIQDEAGRPHCQFGPAISFNDGWKIYAWHGVVVEEKVILNPESLTVAEIDAEENVEIRRVMVERFGEEQYFLAGKLTVIDDDSEFGTLLWRVTTSLFDDEPILMLRVLNSTVEADGSRKSYLLRVPPNMQTAREAVAWTFGLEEGEYHPNKET